MNNDSTERQGHATSEMASRAMKWRKIERLLDIDLTQAPIHVLEVGTGAGGIAHHFGTHSSGAFVVEAVDVNDERQAKDGYHFTKVNSTNLPFADGSFDIVLTNHVIEHVGDEAAQLHHLQEIRRVTKNDGQVYLAVPNRWMLVEPHYGIAFLSWLPRSLRSPYLRLRKAGKFYDCEPLQKKELEDLVRRSGFSAQNLSVRAFRETLAIEGDKGLLARLASRLPDVWLRRTERVIPTHIYLLRPVY